MRIPPRLPKQLGAHRIAAIALYRALLSQCDHLPISRLEISSIKNIIRNRFRIPRAQHLRLALAFETGYHAIDILDASAAGDEAATAEITSLLARVPAHLTQSPLLNKRPERTKNPLHYPPPEPYKFENMFPRAKVEGTRRVPTMVNAQGLPFVRWKKPQPESVSRTIRQKGERRDKRFKYLQEVEERDMAMAQWEDIWEGEVGKLAGGNFTDEEESYEESLKAVQQSVRRDMFDEDRKTMDRIERFTKIILQERELAAREQAQKDKANTAS